MITGLIQGGRQRRLAMIAMLLTPLSHAAATDRVRINELQYIGSHNSYHAGFGPSETQLWEKTQPERFASLNYRHPDLTRQLDSGVHQLELDIYADSRGGRYSHPAINQQVADAGLPSDPPFADAAIMQRPGFKVLHIQDVDQRSTCQPFAACLEQIRAWSEQHPRHLPLFILLETKDERLRLKFPTVVPERFNTATLDALDAEIQSVFPREHYITPDDVRGNYPTLNQAIRTGGWPSLNAARGKILFLLDQHKASAAYLAGHPSLRGRVMFTNSTPGAADAAFVERNEGPVSEIIRLVRAGYLVRARTDAELSNDTQHRDAMMASGAQLLSSDFPRNETANSGYVVQFTAAANVRCNPMLVTAECRDDDLHD